MDAADQIVGSGFSSIELRNKASCSVQQRWCLVKSIVSVVRDRSVKGKGCYETSYYIFTDHLSLELTSKATRKMNKAAWNKDYRAKALFTSDSQSIFASFMSYADLCEMFSERSLVVYCSTVTCCFPI